MSPAVELLEQRQFLSAALPAGSHLVWIDQPVDRIAGQSVKGARVELEDSAGKRMVSANGKIQLRLLHTTTPVGELFNVRLNAGRATFPSFRITEPASYKLEANTTGIGQVFSNPFSVAPGPAVSMKLTSFEGAGYFNYAEIQLFDRFGNLATNDSSVIESDRSRGSGYDAGIVSTGDPNAVSLGSAWGSRAVNGIANFTITAEMAYGKPPSQVHLRDSNPRIRPLWTPGLTAWIE